MDDEALKGLIEKLKQESKNSKSSQGEEETGEEEEVNEDDEIEINEDDEAELEEEEENIENEEDLTENLDIVAQLRARVHQWAIEAVKVGNLVSKPRSQKKEKLAEYEAQVSKMAVNLIARLVLPHQWFLVRWGGTRKGSGTFYTRPQLAVPTVRRTLAPLVYEDIIPKTPETILKLKICDPAMGSGSFLVATLRYLTDALYESLHYHQRIKQHGNETLCRLADGKTTNSLLEETLPLLPDSEQFEEALKARLKRYIVEKCIYGVDIDPLAVELARLALWVETMDKSLPFSFLDHKLKCGNALVGCWFDRFQDYPVMAWERDGGDKNHSKFIHHFRESVGTRGKNQGKLEQKGDKWTQAIKDLRNGLVKGELKTILEALDPNNPTLEYPNFELPKIPTDIHNEALAIFEEIHNLPVFDTENREKIYREKVTKNDVIQRLKFAFDTWCAVWFWHGDLMEYAPTPSKFFNPPAETKKIIQDLAQQYQFFHWELEFPDVFSDPPQNSLISEIDPFQNSLINEIDPFQNSLINEIDPFQNSLINEIDPPQPPLIRGENSEELEKVPFNKGDLGGSQPSLIRGENSEDLGVRVSGFSAIIGNPPWEIQKPNSMEFFSNIDPLYRTYGKQEALTKQTEYFTNSADIEKNWLAYCDKLKALSNWTKNVGLPWGDPQPDDFSHKGNPAAFSTPLTKHRGGSFSISRSKKETNFLHELWRNRRSQQKGYADPKHPFLYQGSADINTYKMFLELSLALLAKNGRMGLIVPSGIYTDKGATDLRTEFLEFNQWQWLFGFENRDKIFDIDSRFKFCPIIVTKGGQTTAIKTTFMQRSLTTWENAEAFVLDYPRTRVEQFSPNSKAILEIKSQRDLDILEKMYANSILLGDDSPQGWGIQYATEFHMTNDSKLFPPRPQWEKKGYIADEYGHWLKGNWQDVDASANWEKSILNRPDGVILSCDRTKFILIDDVEDVALPLYEGRMIGQFDFSQKGWVSGKGRSAVWRDIPFENKVIQPQFLMSLNNCISRIELGLKIPIMNIGSSTNYRTLIGSIIRNFPCGHSLNPIRIIKEENSLIIGAILNSICFDYMVRGRLGGLNISFFVLDETAILIRNNKLIKTILKFCSSLFMVNHLFAREWLYFQSKFINDLSGKNYYQLWAITPYERLRLRNILDAVIAELYGLEIEDFKWILRECDYPTEQVTDKTFARTLDPKGFWRVDKEKEPELRHTVLSLVAFCELKRLGLEEFLALNDGEGWMLPDTLTLADYGLGHDDRAKQPQPVAERFLPSPLTPVNKGGIDVEKHKHLRYYPWQLEKSVEESWRECEIHAKNLRKLLGESENLPESDKTDEPNYTIEDNKNLPSNPDFQPPTDLFGNPLDVDLFGNVIDNSSSKKRK